MKKLHLLLLLLPAAALLTVLGAVVLGTVPELGEHSGPSRAEASGGDGGGPVRAGPWQDEPAPAPSDPEPRREAAPETTPTGAPGPVVLVVDGTSGSPLAGVDVHILRRETARERYRSGDARNIDYFDRPLRFGFSRSTDASGRVGLPAVDDTIYVCARHGDLFGYASLRGNRPEETLLALVPDLFLRVRVTDAAGKAAPGIPVAVYRGREWDEADAVWEGTTGGDGLAEIRHFQIHSERQSEEGDRFAAAITLPLLHPEAVEFDGLSPPAEPIRLVLPATGSLEVRLTGPDARPLAIGAHLLLVPVRPPEFALPLPIEDHFEHLRARKGIDREPFRFPSVGLGLEFRPRLRLDGDRSWRWGEILRGPDRPGETARVEVSLPDEFTVLAARLVDGAARALADRGLRYELTADDARNRSDGTRTDGEGRFELAVRLGDHPGPYGLQLRVEGGEGGSTGLRTNLGGLRLGRRNDLGDLVVADVANVAHGRVVDDLGEPVANADVRLQRFGRRGDREGWHDTRLGRTRTDDDGTFAIPGPAPDGRLRVRARARDHVDAASPEIARGAELTLELLRTGTLIGSVLLPDWLPSRAATVRLVSRENPRQSERDRLRRRDGPTPFEIDDLTPGIYDAVVELRNLPEPLERVGGIVIGSGENEDSRLQRLDLRNHFHRYRLRAVDASGRHLTDQNGPILVRHERADGQTGNLGFRWQKGTAVILTASPTIDVTVFGVGYQPRTETLGPGDHSIYMHRLQPARIHLPGARELCGWGRKVRVSMVFTGDTGLPQSLSGIDQRTGRRFSYPRWELSKSNGAWLGETDTVDVPLSRNGPHEVILRLYQEGVGGNASVPVGIADVVVDGPEPREHTLTVDPQKIAAAIARLQARAERQAGRGRRQRNGR